MTELKKRENPCLVVYCQCGSVFAASQFNKQTIKDTEWIVELCGYAEQGNRIEVKDSTEFKFGECKCNK